MNHIIRVSVCIDMPLSSNAPGIKNVAYPAAIMYPKACFLLKSVFFWIVLYSSLGYVRIMKIPTPTK